MAPGVKIQREAHAAPVAVVAKKHGISDRTIYLWRKRYGALEAIDVKRLRHLEQKSACVRRAQVAYVEQRGLSRRRACAPLSVARSTLGCQLGLALKDEPVVAAMRDRSIQSRGTAIVGSWSSWRARGTS